LGHHEPGLRQVEQHAANDYRIGVHAFRNLFGFKGFFGGPGHQAQDMHRHGEAAISRHIKTRIPTSGSNFVTIIVTISILSTI
jgi:hypothetical protein